MDKYRIDGHKLLYHVPRVHDWLEEKVIFPIYMEISPSGACNHRCTYCALDFMEYEKRFLDADVLKQRLAEMAGLGLRSVMLAGEGEPFLHRRIGEIIRHCKTCGVEVGITTNGVLLREELAREILENVEWVKVSINGAGGETYSRIHRAPASDLDKVWRNMSYAAALRRKKGWRCALGMQLLLLPENQHEAVPLARLAKEAGMDYLVVKPYSQHPQSKTDRYRGIRYSNYMHLAQELKVFNDDDFEVVFRAGSMQRWDKQKHDYSRCLALPFWSYVDAGGNVWGCSVFLGDQRFLYGNIYQNTFREIWEGERRLESLRWVEGELDANRCRVGCRMDKVNSYLWDLKNPPEHVNFI